MKNLILILSCVASTGVFAMGANQDYSASVYGDKAQQILKLLPKLKDGCGYAQATVADQGDLGNKALNTLINDKNINSVLCMQIGESTFACEESTLWFSEACGIKQN